MSTEQRKHYVDFRETGGVVHSSPTRMLPELVFTGRTKSQLDIELEQHAKMVQETLGFSAWKGVSLARAPQLARPIFLDLSLPFPGLTELKDGFYTGWFYTTEAGIVYSAFRRKDDVPLSPYLNQHQKRRSPYFLLDKREAVVWNQKVKQGPLSVGQIDDLCLSSNLQAHPAFQSLAELDIKNLTDIAVSTANSFWNGFKKFDRNDRSSEKIEFLRNNLLNLEILEIVYHFSYRAALKEVRESMERNEITVFPLGQDRCAVRYITDVGNRQTRARTLPLPHDLIKHFQRYGRLGERPMTKGAFETLYRRFVDPKTKLFEKGS